MPVYFIQSGEGRPIKIGYSFDVPGRLKSMQAENPDTLILLGTMLGDTLMERSVQEHFAAHQIRGQWFRPHPDIILFATDTAAQAAFVPRVDKWKSWVPVARNAAQHADRMAVGRHSTPPRAAA